MDNTQKNLEKMREARRRWYHKNKERANEAHRIWYKKNKKKVRSQEKKWRTGNERFWKKKAEYVKEYKRQKLTKLKGECGGKCMDCGYKEEIGILQFHHLKGKKDKRFNVASSESYKKMKAEAEKCILLCPNCHTLRHYKQRYGYLQLPQIN